MIKLFGGAQSLQAVTAGSSTNLDWFIDYTDVNANLVVDSGVGQGNLAAPATTTIVPGPATNSYTRQINYISFLNNDAVNDVTVQVQNSVISGTFNLTSAITLPSGYALRYQNNIGWQVFDNNGTVSPGAITLTGAVTGTGIGIIPTVLTPIGSSGSIPWNDSGTEIGTTQISTDGTTLLLTDGTGNGSIGVNLPPTLGIHAFTFLTPDSGSGNSTDIFIKTGDLNGNTGNAGNITLISGQSNFVGSSAAGGNVAINGGDGSFDGASYHSVGAALHLSGGGPSNIGGDVNINAGSGDQTGGNLNLFGGDGSGPAGNGGNVLIAAGGGSGTGANGTLELSSGTSIQLQITTELDINGSPGTTGQALVSQGPGVPPIWTTASIPPGGSPTELQFNNSGVFGGTTLLNYIDYGAKQNPQFVAGNAANLVGLIASQTQTLATVDDGIEGTFTLGAGAVLMGSGTISNPVAGAFLTGGASVCYGAGSTWNPQGHGGAPVGGTTYNIGGDAYTPDATVVYGGAARIVGGVAVNSAGTAVGGDVLALAARNRTGVIAAYTLTGGSGYPLDGTFFDNTKNQMYTLNCASTFDSCAAYTLTISGGVVTAISIGGMGDSSFGFGGVTIGDIYVLSILDTSYPGAPATQAQITVTAVTNQSGGQIILRDANGNNAFVIDANGNLTIAPSGTVTFTTPGALVVQGLTATIVAGGATAFSADSGSTQLLFASVPVLTATPTNTTVTYPGGTTPAIDITTAGIAIGGDFVINVDESWSLNSTEGVAGNVLTSGGPGVTPQWSVPIPINNATLTGASTAVADVAVTASSKIFITIQDPNGGTPGFLWLSGITAGVGFTINSSSILDTSIVAYQRIG